MIYYYKNNPYRIVCDSHMKIGGLWIDVIIYEALYGSVEGKYFVREKDEFYKLFLPQEI
jgi:hypothetical protein